MQTVDVDPIVDGMRCRAMWQVLLLNELQPPASNHSSPERHQSASFLFAERGPWAQARHMVCDAAGVDESALRRAAARWLPPAPQAPAPQPPARRPPAASERQRLVLSALPLGVPRHLSDVAAEAGLAQVEVRGVMDNLKRRGHVFLRVARFTFVRTAPGGNPVNTSAAT